MNTLNLVLTVILGVAASIILFLIAGIVLKKKPYEFEMVFMRPGVNEHTMIRGASLDSEYEINGEKYEIKADRLYRVKPRFPIRIFMRLRSIKQRFIVVYSHGKKVPIEPVDVTVTARILKEVNESRALDRAMREEFKVPMDMKKILMILGVLIISAVIYVLMTGEVQL